MGGWLDQLKLRLISAMAFVELGLELKINFHGWVAGGWMDQLKIRLISAMAFVELGLELSFEIFTSTG